MKAIILISSIFYILGLKISNKIELVKKTNPVEKIITHKLEAAKPEKAADFQTEEKAEEANKKETTCEETDSNEIIE